MKWLPRVQLRWLARRPQRGLGNRTPSALLPLRREERRKRPGLRDRRTRRGQCVYYYSLRRRLELRLRSQNFAPPTTII